MDSPVALIAVALLAGAALVLRTERARAVAMLAALTLAPVILLAHIWDSDQLDTLRDRPSLAAVAAVLGAVGLAAAARLFTRRPELFPLAVVALLPFRVPISAGGSTSNLLVPLYLVIAAGALAWAVPRLRADDRVNAPPAERRRPQLLDALLAGTVVLYALQAIDSSDRDQALEQLVFFYVPFTVLYALLLQVTWTRDLLRRCLVVLVALAGVLAAIGGYEYATKTLLLKPDVLAANEFEDYFRVTSLFFDPNIYGRFLVVVMLGLAGVLAFARQGRTVAICAGLLALLWAGLVLTLSQSSFAALLSGLAVLAALRWSPRRTATVAGALLVVGVAFVLAAPGAINLDLGDSRSADNATSGRVDLMEGGIELAGNRPVLGWGSGAFSREYRRQENVSAQRAVSASHTIPITVAAEQGIVGLALYLALLAAALARLLRGAARSVPRAVVGAGFVALIVHTMLYAAFLEDPLAWALLGVGSALAAAAARESAALGEPAVAAVASRVDGGPDGVPAPA